MRDGENVWPGTERRAPVQIDYEELARAFAQAMPHQPCLSHEEHQWVQLAIQKEAQSIRLRQAIIEKTLGSLVWAGIVGAGMILLEYLRNHGFKS